MAAAPAESCPPPEDGKPAAENLISAPLIAMIAVVGAAFLVVFYVRLLSRHLSRFRRRWRRWRLRHAASDLESSAGHVDFSSSAASSSYFLSPYGLDDSTIKTLPVSLFNAKSSSRSFYRDCAVCLVEFEDNELLRTLPVCSHAFHVDCIDVWLRSHANCPLCRAAVTRHEPSPFVPMRAARIRPSFDDFFLPEITAAESPNGDGNVGRNFLLKRSYSFGFERTVTEAPLTASPWRYRQRGGSLWSKRWASPFGTGSRTGPGRVFSFRSGSAGVGKSPFFRRRGFLPLSESGVRFGPRSRRTRSMASPVPPGSGSRSS